MSVFNWLVRNGIGSSNAALTESERDALRLARLALWALVDCGDCLTTAMQRQQIPSGARGPIHKTLTELCDELSRRADP